MAAGEERVGGKETHRMLGDSSLRESDRYRVSWGQWRERLQVKEMEKEKMQPWEG